MAMMQFEQKTVDTLKIGDFSLFTKTVSETDIVLYAGISADFAPVHLNEQYAAQTRFGSRIAHPMLLGTMAGGAIYRLLSPSSICVKREFEVIAPVFAGETVTIRAEIASLDREHNRVVVEFECYNVKEELVLRGSSLEALDLVEGEQVKA
ncbi:3-hydroxybutyryl-CoA dehydratase [Enterocloster lavalensis]|uniref:3-hydroxybutyryl-CoA dehydratase n=2 Tax=Lachnospiraceae TaxID=186803 RepID=A0A1I0HSA0_9FIRM|nr:MaoC family dehydratase [Enterocloster asparagiformis]SET86924.1 3-hydroxybutyryl-CoA dehydratase [Enterocloster lavalensis]